MMRATCSGESKSPFAAFFAVNFDDGAQATAFVPNVWCRFQSRHKDTPG